MAYSSDGTKLFVGNAGVECFNTQDWKQVTSYRFRSYHPEAIASAPQSSIVAIDAGLGAILWDSTSDTVKDRIAFADVVISDLLFSHSTKYLAWAGKRVVVFSLEDRKELSSYAPNAPLVSMVFSADDTVLFLGTSAGEILAWNIAQSKVEYTLMNARVPSLAISLTHPNLLCCGSYDGTVTCWDLPTRTALRVTACGIDSVNAVAISKDGNLLVAGGGGPSMFFQAPGHVAILTWPGLIRVRSFPAHSLWVTGAAFSPIDNSQIATIDYSGQVRVWDLEQ
jgi:WD40 repeat protein